MQGEMGVGGAPSVELLTMHDDEDWLMRPVVEGKCSYESLKDGTLDLDDVDRLNHALDVHTENTRRLHQAVED